MLKDILPARYRAIVYRLYSVVGLLVGAIQVGFVTAAVAQPVALTVTVAVLAYLGIGLGFVAAANTPANGSQSDSDGL